MYAAWNENEMLNDHCLRSVSVCFAVVAAVAFIIIVTAAAPTVFVVVAVVVIVVVFFLVVLVVIPAAAVDFPLSLAAFEVNAHITVPYE